MNAAGVSARELCFQEATKSRLVAIPRQSVTVGGYLRAGEKETPRKPEAQILSGIYAHIGLPREEPQAGPGNGLKGEATYR